MLDGDDVEDCGGAMLSASSVLEYVTQALTQKDEQRRAELQGLVEWVISIKKKRDTPRELNTWDGKTEQFIGYGNDGDHSFNRACDDLSAHIQSLIGDVTETV